MDAVSCCIAVVASSCCTMALRVLVLVSSHDLRAAIKCPSHARGEGGGGVGHDPLHWVGRSVLRFNVHLWRSAPRTPWSSVLRRLGHLGELAVEIVG